MFQEYIGFPKCFSVTQLEYIKKNKTTRPNNTRKDLSPGPKNQNFQKMKETSQGIHPRNSVQNCLQAPNRHTFIVRF